MADTTALQLHITERERGARGILTALLPPLALYASLCFTLGKLFATPPDAFALLCGVAALCLCALLPERIAAALRLAAVIGATLALALVAGVRDGALALVNRLYGSSEAVNAYAYERFAVPDETASALLIGAALLGTLCAFASCRRWALTVLFLGVTLLESYFGVTPGLWRNIFLFAVLALLLVFNGRETGSAVALLAGLAAVTLAVCLLALHPNAAVETCSERLRDELGAAAMRVMQSGPQPENETNRIHQESRQHEELASEDALQGRAQREFDRQTQSERELALPRRVDWLRIAGLLLAALALLILPFLPFLLLNRAKRRTEERRAAFADADNAAAIRAMFAHTVDWLRAGGLDTENRPFAACEKAVEAIISREYAARYAEAVPIWQEAAYSNHAMTDGQREAVRELLNTTAETLYEKAGVRTKLRMKYIECLCGS